MNYYNGWPTNGEYVNKLNHIENTICKYLINFPKLNYKLSVIFDIDDTLLFSNKSQMSNNTYYLKQIIQIGNILRLCNELNFKIIIITARPEESRVWSIENLKMYNLPFHEIYHNKYYPDINFKIQLQKQLSQFNKIILSIGDQWPDILGLSNCLCIKLPSVQDHNSYFTFNNINYYPI